MKIIKIIAGSAMLAGFFFLSHHVSAAIITVDGVACTLQNAITASNTNTDSGTCTTAGGDVTGSYGDDEIVLTSNISLTGVYSIDNGENGLPPVNPGADELIIRSNVSGTQRTISRAGGSPNFRLLYIKGGTVTLQDLIFSNGNLEDASGGNVLIDESSGNSDITLSNITIQNGNVVDNFGLGTLGGGGLAVTGGDVTITDSLFQDNGATSSGIYGGAFFMANANVIIESSEFTNNDIINNYGSTIAAKFSGELDINDTHIHDNIGKGLMYFEDNALTVDITDSIIEDNAEVAEIIFADTVVGNIIRTTIRNNTSTTGGFHGDHLAGIIIESSDVAINYSTISGNSVSGDYGVAGIVVKGGLGGNSIVYLENSTISGNRSTATNGFAGIFTYPAHGTRTQRAEIVNTTITENTASNAGLIVYGANNRVSSMRLNNTIIFGNHSTRTGVWSENCIRRFTVTANASLETEGGNILGDMGTSNSSYLCTASLDSIEDLVDQTDIGLDDNLDDNGGPTETHALEADSIAIDFGKDGSVVYNDDQRGEDRPFDGNGDLLEEPDSGSYELGEIPVGEEAPCDTADCTPNLLRFACKDPSADPILSTLFLVTTDVRYGFYTHLSLLCKYAEYLFSIEPLVSDEPLDITPLTPEEIPQAFDAVLSSSSCPIFSEFISPKLFYTRTERREILLWQTFLRDRFNEPLTLTGLYDAPTREAIIRFQTRFGEVILRPWTWGPSKLSFKPTARIYKLTQSVANILTGCSVIPQWVEDAQTMFDVQKAMQEKYPEALQNLPVPGTGLIPAPATTIPTRILRRR